MENFTFNDNSLLNKLKNESKRKILFSSNFSECEAILNECNMIFYIHLDEDKFYTESIMNRISYEKYKKDVFSSFINESRFLLGYLNRYKSKNKFLILDFSRSYHDTLELVKQINFWLQQGTSIQEKYILETNFVLQELSRDLPERNSNHVWKTFDKFRKIYFNQYSNKINKYLNDFDCPNRAIKNKAIDNLIDLFSFKYKKIAEERNSLKTIISRGTEQPYKKILTEINYFCHNFDLSRLIGLTDILNYVTDNSKNRLIVLKDPEYKRILLNMIFNSNKIIQTKATELLNTMFKDSAFKNSKEFDYYCQSFAKENNLFEQILQIVICSCRTILSCTNYEDVTRLNSEYKYLKIVIVKEILESSPDNLKKIKSDDFFELLDLFDLGIQSIRKTNHYFQMRLLSELAFILGKIIKIVQEDILKKINIEKYLRQTLILMLYCLDTFGEFSKTYLSMVFETFNILILLGDKHYFKLVNSYYYLDEIDFFNKCEHIENDYQNNKEIQIIDCYRKYLIMMQKKNSIEEFINFNKDQAEFSVKYNQMKIEFENNKIELKKKTQEIEELNNQIEHLTNENKIYIEKLKAESNLNLKHESFDKTPVSKPSIVKLTCSEIDENKINSSLDAKNFIQNIEYKYENISDFRPLICKSLKHLTDNLYTSKYHFIYELIQNADDAKFDQNPSLKIIVDKDSITFCSNEKGFNSSDILSICSISDSKKLKGLKIGNKGIGFKSVFSISNEPVIYSKPFWKFYFLKEKDEISYMTPHYMENLPASLQLIVNENESMNTFIHLKFKNKFIFDDKIFDLLDPNILLFTNNLEHLILEDKTCFSSKQIKRIKKELDNFEIIKLEDGSDESEFRVYHEIIKIDDYLTKKEELACNEIKISIAFPNQFPSLNKFSIYSFFPIENESIQWPFMVNAYWSLITNRENLKICKYNELIRDCLAEMYCKSVNNDQILKNNLAYILPAHERLNKWWRIFSMKIKKFLKLEMKINHKRFRNEALQSRLDVSDKILNLVNFEIIQNLETSKMELEYFLDVKQISIEDIVSFFDVNNQNDEIQNWIDSRSRQWWSDFFYELISNRILIDPFKFRIFLLRKKSG